MFGIRGAQFSRSNIGEINMVKRQRVEVGQHYR
jgi:hypothetical protein